MKKLFGIVAIFSLLFLILSGIYVGTNATDTYLFGKKPLIMGTNAFEPEIKQYALCIADKCEDREKLKKGDIVIYNMYLEDNKVITCGVIEKDNNTRIKVKAPTEDGFENIIKKTDVKCTIEQTLNGTAPILKILANKYIFFPLVILSFGIDLVWIFTFIKRKIG